MRHFLILVLGLLIISISAHAQLVGCIDKTVTLSKGVGESGVLDATAKWTNGSTLTVRFMGGTPAVQQRIMAFAQQWQQYANIKFNVVSSGNSDIRIAFNRGGYWSYCGTQARRMGAGEPTMNFEGFNERTSDVEMKRTVLHEFGHALGLLHEHKSPLAKIQWNPQKVYAYFMQTQGWSKEQVDQQVINRYSVTMSNKEYDPQSIMHYPIDGSLTMDGYSVGWNNNLSAGDKTLIGEMYPFFGTRPTDPPVTSPGTTNGAAACRLDNVSIDHNVLYQGKYGMRIKGTFLIERSLNQSCKFVAYFYYANGTPLRDRNGVYNTQDGAVATGKDLVPRYASTQFTGEELFLPYDELHVGNGNFNLKAEVSVFDAALRPIARGGATFFTFRSGAVFSPILNTQTFENNQSRMVVMPKFSVENARGQDFLVATYVHYQNGTPVTWYNPATRRNEPVAFSMKFRPGYDNTTYNYGYYSDLFIYISYNYFQAYRRRTWYKYYTAIFQNGQQIATSGWTEFYLDK